MADTMEALTWEWARLCAAVALSSNSHEKPPIVGKAMLMVK